MLAYNYTFTNNSSGDSFTIGLNEDGTRVCDEGRGIMLQSYPIFDLAVRNDQRNKAGQHGIWDFFSFYGQRNITFQGVIMADTHASLIAFQDQIRQVLTLPAQPVASTDDGYVNIKWTDVNNEEWNINAKILSDIQFSRTIGNQIRCSFLISMKAESPFILSTTEFSETQLRGWRMGQMLLPAFLPGKINIKYNEVLNIYQTGTADAPATYRLSGPGTNLKVTKLTESFSNSVTLSDFSSGWSGGTADVTNFQTAGVARKLTSTGSQATMSLTQALDLSSPDYLTFYFYVDDASNFELGDYTTGENYIKFIETAGVDEFVLELNGGNDTIKDGWNYFTALKQQFKTIGSPSWENITKTEFSIKAKTGTTLNVTFDDLRNRDIVFTEQKLELNTTIATNEYVDFDVLNGTILKNDGTDMTIYLSSDSTWFYISPKQNLILCESSDANPNITYEFPYTFRDPVDSTGIVGYWHFDNKNALAVTDFVGSDDGTFVGAGLNYLSSPINGSQYFLDYPGTGSYVDYLTPFRNLVTTSAAVVVNFKTTSFASDFTILYRYFGIDDSRIEYDQASDELRITYKIDGATKTITVASFSSSYSVDTWYQIIVNFDVTTGATAYIDNVSVGSDATTGSLIDTGVSGARFGYGASGENLSGGLDEIRFYNGVTLDADTRALLFFDAAQEKYKNQLEVTWNNAKL